MTKEKVNFNVSMLVSANNRALLLYTKLIIKIKNHNKEVASDFQKNILKQESIFTICTKKKSNSHLSDVTPFKGKQQQSYIL